MTKEEQKQMAEDNARLTEKLKKSEAELAAKAANEVTVKKAVKVELSEDVAKKYELVNWVGSHKQYFGKHGIIDVNIMTVAQADALVKAEWPRLQARS
jgi:hypothetical protein